MTIQQSACLLRLYRANWWRCALFELRDFVARVHGRRRRPSVANACDGMRRCSGVVPSCAGPVALAAATSEAADAPLVTRLGCHSARCHSQPASSRLDALHTRSEPASCPRKRRRSEAEGRRQRSQPGLDDAARQTDACWVTICAQGMERRASCGLIRSRCLCPCAAVLFQPACTPHSEPSRAPLHARSRLWPQPEAR